MKYASLSEVKKELQSKDADELLVLCLRLAKYKKENKELLGYLLFESDNEQAFINQLKEEVDLLFEELTNRNLYLVKKILRKILRFVNRQIKYSGVPQTELELRIYFCEKIKRARIPLTHGTVLFNLYQQQLKKIDSVLLKLPEDIQGDFTSSLNFIQR